MADLKLLLHGDGSHYDASPNHHVKTNTTSTTLAEKKWVAG